MTGQTPFVVLPAICLAIGDAPGLGREIITGASLEQRRARWRNVLYATDLS